MPVRTREASVPDDLASMLPEYGTLRVTAAPHQHGTSRELPITFVFIGAASIPLLAGVTLFGWDTLRVLAICLSVSLFVQAIFRMLARRSHPGWASHAFLIGVLLACTFPPTSPWYIAAVASMTAILVGLCLPGGLGHYLWHPVVIGRLAVQMIFHDAMNPARWPVLARNHLVIGDLSQAKPLPGLWSWWANPSPAPFEAWLVHRPTDVLRSFSIFPAETPSEGLAQLMRDHLPAWNDVLLGGTGGAVGQAAVVALLIAALVLMWRGILRLPAVVAGFATAGVIAAIIPVQMRLIDGLTHCWFPGTAIWQGLPVGLNYVAYHLFEGEFIFVLFLLASDISSSPHTSRGHALAAALLAAITITLRVTVGIPAAAYWALLIVNTVTPMINRATRRRVYGT